MNQMTKDEALKQALEAFEAYQYNGSVQLFDETVTILRQAIEQAEKQEPVGYFSVNDYGNWEQNESGHGEPFYTTPPAAQPAPVQEPVALKPCWYESKEKTMCRKCGQVHAEAIPPAAQRQWAGLTDEDIIPLCSQAWVFDTVKQWAEIIEAKLREKNGGQP